METIPTHDPELLITVEEAANLLRLGRTTTYNLVLDGQLRSVKIGRRRLVVRVGLQEFIARLESDLASA